MEALGHVAKIAPGGSWTDLAGGQIVEAGRGITQAATAFAPTGLMDVTQIRNPQDAMRFVAENAAQMVPVAAGTLAAYATGGIPLTLLSTFLLEGGNSVVNLREKGVAERTAWFSSLGVGATNMLLEAVVPIRVGKLLVWTPKYKAGFLKGVTSGLKTIGLEGTTEGAQEVGPMLAEAMAGVPPTAQEALARVLNSIAGGFAGGIPYAAVDVIQASRGPRTPPPETSPNLSEVKPPEDTTTITAVQASTPSAKADAVSQQDARPPEIIAQEAVKKNRGVKGLFDTYTDVEIRKALEINEEASLRTLIDSGLVAQNTEGLFVLTDKVTGGRSAAFVPVPEVTDWWKDEVTGNLYKNFDPATGSFDEQATFSPENGGQYLWQGPDGVPRTFNTPHLVAKAAAATVGRTLPQGWTKVEDPVREVYTNGTFRVEQQGTNFVTLGPDGKLLNVGIYTTPGNAALAVEDYNIWRSRVHPAARHLWSPWTGDPSKPQPQDRRRSHTAGAVLNERAFTEYERTTSGHFVHTDDTFAKVISTAPIIDKILVHVNTYTRQATVLLEAAAGAIPGFQAISERLEDVGYAYLKEKRGYYTAGSFWSIKPDLSKFVIGLELLPGRMRKTQPNSMAADVYTTLVHELAHAIALGHDGRHEAAIKTIAETLSPIKEGFVNELYKLYTNAEGTGFSPDILKLERRVRARSRQGAAQERKTDYATGRTDRPGAQEPVDSRSPASRAGEIWEGESGGAGTKPGEYFQEDGPESHGDYPPPSADYRKAVNWLRSQRAAEGLQPTTAEPDELAGRVLKRSKKALEMLDGTEGQQEIQEGITHVSRFIRDWTTLRQFEKMFPTVAGLKIYKEMVELFARTKNRVVMWGDQVMKHWMKIHGKLSEQLSNLIGTVMEQSMKEERRLSQAEIIQKAAAMGITDQRVLEVYWEVDKTLVDILQMLKDSQIQEARFLYRALAGPAINEIHKNFAQLENRNYFPMSRFGKHGILVRAKEQMVYDGKTIKKGGTVAFYTWQWKRERDRSFADMQEKFKNEPVDVSTRYVESFEGQFIGFSPTLFDTLVAGLNLTNYQLQRAKEIMYTMAPGQGFVKHLKARHGQGVEGFSTDFQAAFCDYVRHASNHIARATHRRGLEMALKSIKPPATGMRYAAGQQQIHETMSRHYGELLNPKNYSGRVGGLLFAWYFLGSAKHAVVNLCQVPLFTYPYLNKQLTKLGVPSGKSDWLVAQALAKAATIVGPNLHQGNDARLPADLAPHFARGWEEGFLDESMAANLAAFQEYKWLTRFFPGAKLDLRFKQFLDAGLWMFKTGEGFNRNQTFAAAIDLARQQNMDAEAQFQFAKDAVLDTHWEYAAWNRPLVFHWAPALFVFRSYLQHATHFALMNQGGWRFWMMMAVLGGLNAVPFGENLLDLITGLSSFIAAKTGYANWRVDAESELRGLIQDFGANPDAVMNGLARYSLGMTATERLFGMPFPAFDISQSISLGRIIPGTEQISNVLAGTRDVKGGTLDALMQVVGVAGGTGMNLFQALVDPTAESTRFLKYMPSIVRNFSRVGDYVTKGAYVNAQGEPLVDFDIKNPAHITEIVGQLLGATPTRVTAGMEARATERQEIVYWLGRRESILSAYALAVGQGNREGIADQLTAYQRYNQHAPASVRLSPAELQESIRTRVKNQNLRSLGLPTQRRYLELHQQFQQLYPVPQ
ncbi:MAG TPA: PLxRFG domain-containing protein [Dissulfurispiraceae bacterium]|nr:PLxRFG domain-containing protein [Dissulfurispiraceae bacterium]